MARVVRGAGTCVACGEHSENDVFRSEVCRKCINARQRTYYHAQSADKRRRDQLARYGITPDDYAALLEAQGGVCAICKQTTDLLHVDHDHACCPGRIGCGRCVRGLLCQGCNQGIGNFRDRPEVLREAADYLEGDAHARGCRAA